MALPNTICMHRQSDPRLQCESKEATRDASMRPNACDAPSVYFGVAFSRFPARARTSLVGVARMRDFRYCAHPPFGVPSARFHGDSGFSRGSLFYQESGERVGSVIPTPTWRIRQGGPAYSDEGGTYGRRMLYLSVHVRVRHRGSSRQGVRPDIRRGARRHPGQGDRAGGRRLRGPQRAARRSRAGARGLRDHGHHRHGHRHRRDPHAGLRRRARHRARGAARHRLRPREVRLRLRHLRRAERHPRPEPRHRAGRRRELGGPARPGRAATPTSASARATRA